MSMKDAETSLGNNVDDVDQSKLAAGHSEGMKGERMIRPSNMEELVLSSRC